MFNNSSGQLKERAPSFVQNYVEQYAGALQICTIKLSNTCELDNDFSFNDYPISKQKHSQLNIYF